VDFGMSSVDVRLATKEDAQGIAELIAASASPFDVDAELARHYARLWVARAAQHDAIAGVALTWEVADEVHLIDLLVAAPARRRGFGKALLRTLLEAAEGAGFRVVLLEVRRDNAPARSLYDAFGFEVAGEREKYYSDGEDAILMRRELSR
jgi:ribosomal-protein-alanine N-acetyltransferase